MIYFSLHTFIFMPSFVFIIRPFLTEASLPRKLGPQTSIHPWMETEAGTEHVQETAGTETHRQHASCSVTYWRSVAGGSEAGGEWRRGNTEEKINRRRRAWKTIGMSHLGYQESLGYRIFWVFRMDNKVAQASQKCLCPQSLSRYQPYTRCVGTREKGRFGESCISNDLRHTASLAF